MQEKLMAIRRKEFGMTQREFADFIGMNYNTYTKKERGEYQFTSDEMFDISEKLDRSMIEIFSARKHQFGNKKLQEA